MFSSVPTQRFWLKNLKRDKCLKAQNSSVVGTDCTSSDLDMYWIWTDTEQLMNVKTLECMEKCTTRNGPFTMDKCKKYFYSKLSCTKQSELKIGWKFLYLNKRNQARCKDKNNKQKWTSNQELCGSKKNYAGKKDK